MKENSSLMERIVGVLRLDVATFEEIEHDQEATGQAALVVIVVALLSGVGTAMTGSQFNFLGLILGLVGILVGWIIWSALVYYIGTRFFDGTADLGEMLRVIGFARAPSALGILSFIPVLGFVISLVVFVWSIVASVIGVRQGLDISTANAVIVVVIGAVVAFLVSFVLAEIGLGGVAILG